MARQYHGSLININNDTYVVELWDAPTGADSSEELALFGDGFTIERDGRGDEFYTNPIRASECSAYFVMADANDKLFFQTTLARDEEQKWAMRITKNGSLYWVGRVLSDKMEFIYQPSIGYDVVKITAVDALRLISGYEVDPTWFTDTGNRATLSSLIVRMINKAGLSGYWSSSDMYLADAIQHTNTNKSSTRMLQYANARDFVFVNNYDPFVQTENISWMSCSDGIKAILESFLGRIMFSNGSYWITQPNSYDGTTITYDGYDNTGVGITALNNQTLTHRVDYTSTAGVRPKWEAKPVGMFQYPVRAVEVDYTRRHGSITTRSTASTSALQGSLLGCTTGGTIASDAGYAVKIAVTVRYDYPGYLVNRIGVYCTIWAQDSGGNKSQYRKATNSWATGLSSLYDIYYEVPNDDWRPRPMAYSFQLELPEPPAGYTAVYVEIHLTKVTGTIIYTRSGSYITWTTLTTAAHAFNAEIRIAQSYTNTAPYQYELKETYTATLPSPRDVNAKLLNLKSAFANGGLYDINSLFVYNGSAYVAAGDWDVSWHSDAGDLPQVLAAMVMGLYTDFLPVINGKWIDAGDYLEHKSINYDSYIWLFNGGTYYARSDSYEGEWLAVSVNYSLYSGDGSGQRTIPRDGLEDIRGQIDGLKTQLLEINNSLAAYVPERIMTGIINDGLNTPTSDPGADTVWNVQLAYTYDSEAPTLDWRVQKKGDNDWISVFKDDDETVTEDTVLSTDGHLFFDMEADTYYTIRGRVYFDTSATADFKYQITGPSSPTLVRSSIKTFTPTAGESLTYLAAYPGPLAVAVTSTDDRGYMFIDMIVHNVNSGTFAFTWAQNTSSTDTTTVRAASYLEYMKITSVEPPSYLLLENGDYFLLENGDQLILG